MERVKKKNILLRLWERLGESDIDDNEYKGVSEEERALLTRKLSALDMLGNNSGKKGGKKSSASEMGENTKTIIDSSNRNQIIRRESSRDDGFERE